MEIIPCTQATFLMSKREENALTLHEHFQLLVHLLVCKFCKRFLKQTRAIARRARKLSSAEFLSSAEKRKMLESLKLA